MAMVLLEEYGHIVERRCGLPLTRGTSCRSKGADPDPEGRELVVGLTNTQENVYCHEIMEDNKTYSGL
jgi:hypothetical protein